MTRKAVLYLPMIMIVGLSIIDLTYVFHIQPKTTATNARLVKEINEQAKTLNEARAAMKYLIDSDVALHEKAEQYRQAGVLLLKDDNALKVETARLLETSKRVVERSALLRERCDVAEK